MILARHTGEMPRIYFSEFIPLYYTTMRTHGADRCSERLAAAVRRPVNHLEVP